MRSPNNDGLPGDTNCVVCFLCFVGFSGISGLSVKFLIYVWIYDVISWDNCNCWWYLDDWMLHKHEGFTLGFRDALERWCLVFNCSDFAFVWVIGYVWMLEIWFKIFFMQLDDWAESSGVLRFLVGAKIWVLPKNTNAPLGGKYVLSSDKYVPAGDNPMHNCTSCFGYDGCRWTFVRVHFNLWLWYCDKMGRLP